MVTSSLHTCAHVHMHLKAHIQTHEHAYTIHTYTHWRNRKFTKVWNRRIKLNLKPQNVDRKSPVVFKGSRGRQTFQALCHKSKSHSQDNDKTDRLGNPSWTQTQFKSVAMADISSFLSSMLGPRTQRDFCPNLILECRMPGARWRVVNHGKSEQGNHSQRVHTGQEGWWPRWRVRSLRCGL